MRTEIRRLSLRLALAGDIPHMSQFLLIGMSNGYCNKKGNTESKNILKIEIGIRIKLNVNIFIKNIINHVIAQNLEIPILSLRKFSAG